MTSLIDIKKGKVKVVSIIAGRGAESKLAQLGILPGKEMEVLSNVARGPVMIRCDNSRFILGCGLAAKVMVERLNEDS